MSRCFLPKSSIICSRWRGCWAKHWKRRGAARVVAEYRALAPILEITEALAQDSFHGAPLHIRRDDAGAAISASPCKVNGEVFMGGQEHFYLETQCSIARLDESGGIIVDCSTQHPTAAQQVIGRVLGIPWSQVTVQCLRMGGGFGGKESQANPWTAIAALGAWKTKRPVRG